MLIAFFVMLAVRAIFMRQKKGIKAFVFGKTDKSDFLYLIVVALFVYAAVAKVAGLPMWDVLVKPFWNTEIPGWIGIVFCILAIIGFLISLYSFGDSLRVGIDEEKPGKLVTTGIFAYSRNPLYLCIITFFIGFFLVHKNIIAAAIVVFFTLAIHRQILREEAYLKVHYAGEYESYCAKTRRYI